MLFDYVFLLPGADQLRDYALQTKKYQFVIPINAADLQYKADLFHQCHQSPHSIAFFIKGDAIGRKTDTHPLVRFLTTMMFLPNYLKYREQYLLFLESPYDSKEQYCFQEQLSAGLKQQGIDPLLIEEVDANGKIISSGGHSLCILHEGLQTYVSPGNKAVQFQLLVNNLVTPSTIEKKLLLHLPSKNEFNNITEKISQLENWVQQTQPVLSRLIRENRETNDATSSLKKQSEILQVKLKNSYDNLKVLKDNALWYVYQYEHLQREIKNGNISAEGKAAYEELSNRVKDLQKNRDTILEWYQKEYEVLPTWFKRLGHIIKVMTGKRTVKSLFK